ncbi:MAG: Uma2 family endonuclease [Leptospiraceae bacterium]|nr:Uma2 family endonuclease [Leptospiraceae bacterium]MCP5513770.1 Uma2 family endonuclease [Leptospiraceae bacterium]
MPSTLEKQVPKYAGRVVTREEYIDLPEDGFRYDMIEGVLQVSPSPEFEHANCSSNFHLLLGNFIKKNHLGKIVMKCDVLLPDGGDVIRPDISVILKENLGIIIRHIHGAPDLVAEILSPSTRDRDLGIKADRYLASGVKEFWIIDPKDKTVQVWKNEKSSWKKETGDVLQSTILKGLVIQSKEVFE